MRLIPKNLLKTNPNLIIKYTSSSNVQYLALSTLVFHEDFSGFISISFTNTVSVVISIYEKIALKLQFLVVGLSVNDITQ